MLYANLTQGLGLDAEPEAHVMTLPYTPLQAATRHVEEDEPPEHDRRRARRLLVAQPGRAGLRGMRRRHRLRVAYVQVGGGAIPVSLSDALRELNGAAISR